LAAASGPGVRLLKIGFRPKAVTELNPVAAFCCQRLTGSPAEARCGVLARLGAGKEQRHFFD
jgi:hypothetical protein